MQVKVLLSVVNLVKSVRHLGVPVLQSSGLYQKQHAHCEWRQFKMADNSANFDEEEFYKKLLLEETKKLENLTPDRHEFVPKPGHVIKLRSSKDEKVFINVCTSDKIPAPKEVSDQELVDILQSVDPTQYRVPMSLGEPHVELDNRGQGVVYSILIKV